MKIRHASGCLRWIGLFSGALAGLGLAGGLMAGLATGGSATAAPPVIEQILRPFARHGVEPESCADPAVETLAENIDWLEHTIDRWGSIVAKTPDVWGQARLTKHRREIESQLAEQLGGFEERINGAASVRDLALLAAAVSTAGGGSPSINTLLGGGSNVAVNLSSDVGLIESDRIETFGLDTRGAVFAAERLQLDQVTVLDQRDRYLRHLSALRRTNEGDDAADAPGYSINLVRLPVSILPGNRSAAGHGAEITINAQMVLDDDLLPQTFGDLVVNDLVDQLALPLTRFLNQSPARNRELVRRFERREAAYLRLVDRLRTGGRIIPAGPDAVAAWRRIEPLGPQFHQLGLDGIYLRPDISRDDLPAFASEIQRIIEALEDPIETPGVAAEGLEGLPQPQPQPQPRQMFFDFYADLLGPPETGLAEAVWTSLPTEVLDRFRQPDALFVDLRRQLSTVNLPSGVTRRSTLPFPPSQLLTVYGPYTPGVIATAAWRSFRSDAVNRHVIHLTDTRALLREEITAAYRMLSLPPAGPIWDWAAANAPAIHAAVRSQNEGQIGNFRREYFGLLDQSLGLSSAAEPVEAALTHALGWPILVESILLGERLNQQLADHDVGPVCAAMFGPNPPAEARSAFAAYVAARWPLRIFTIDPVANEQNIADTASIARQMQFAAAFSVASGETTPGAAMRFVRTLQREFATVSTHRTAIGFVHGDDTFGWRFEPRFQTPPVQNNAVVVLRDLIGGGPTDRALRRGERIEPGMRQCVAVILTPSFVTDVTFDTRSNWYCLNKPGRSALSMSEIARQSRAITAMRTAAATCVRRPDLYRDGEVGRMLRRVDQLDAELPLQTIAAAIPNSNTLGGFEIFAGGIRELAPELLGWYGSPGYRRGVDGQTFYLVGDNFSVHETDVIVGTRRAEFELLSRQIMRVTLPGDVPAIDDPRLLSAGATVEVDGDPEGGPVYDGYVDAHVATPYGVSGHLLIPVVR